MTGWTFCICQSSWPSVLRGWPYPGWSIVLKMNPRDNFDMGEESYDVETKPYHVFLFGAWTLSCQQFLWAFWYCPLETKLDEKRHRGRNYRCSYTAKWLYSTSIKVSFQCDSVIYILSIIAATYVSLDMKLTTLLLLHAGSMDNKSHRSENVEPSWSDEFISVIAIFSLMCLAISVWWLKELQLQQLITGKTDLSRCSSVPMSQAHKSFVIFPCIRRVGSWNSCPYFRDRNCS